MGNAEDIPRASHFRDIRFLAMRMICLCHLPECTEPAWQIALTEGHVGVGKQKKSRDHSLLRVGNSRIPAGNTTDNNDNEVPNSSDLIA